MKKFKSRVRLVFLFLENFLCAKPKRAVNWLFVAKSVFVECQPPVTTFMYVLKHNKNNSVQGNIQNHIIR